MGGPTVKVTLYPLSLMRLTMSPWWRELISTWFTARILSPTCSLPQRSAGEPEKTKYVSKCLFPDPTEWILIWWQSSRTESLPGIILPIVEPALLTLEMITKPKPSFSSLETVTS